MKFSIKTFGCKVNQYESELMREDLVCCGFMECAADEIPEICIINSCTVTGNADRQARYAVNRMRRANPATRIVVTGCYAEKNEDEISALPGVFKVVKNSDKDRIASILNGRRKTEDGRRIISDFKGHTKAFVKIQDGCENFCSYCKVPYVRGPFRSRSLDEIVEETALLVSKGFKEIVLTGICLGAWGIERGEGLCRVLRALDGIKDGYRIRLSSIEPKYVTGELIELMSGSRKMCRHLHIPLQSGDDEILRRMNRPYSSRDFGMLVEDIRSKIGDIAVTTDVMTGFPGETKKSFTNTLDLMKEIKPARTHIFTYSRREGTAAYGMSDIPPADILKERFLELRSAALLSSYAFRKHFVDTFADVLVETRRDSSSGRLTGYSGNYIKVLFGGPDSIMRTIVPVRISEATLNETVGVYAD